MTRSALINVMAQAVIKASKGLLRDFGEVGNLQVSRKGTANFVTAADLRAEKVIREELYKARPQFGFLMEESGEVAGRDPSMRWVIDPLDGTTNFIHAVPYFCISVGLEKRLPDGGSELLAGVIYDPIHNDLFHAEKQGGAFLNDRRLRASARSDMSEVLLSTGSPRSGSAEYEKSLVRLQAVKARVGGIRFCGAAALDLAYVAAGRFDGYWHAQLQPWDMAAGILLIQEAGGIVTTLDGDARMMATGNVVAGNRSVQPQLREIMQQAS